MGQQKLNRSVFHFNTKTKWELQAFNGSASGIRLELTPFSFLVLSLSCVLIDAMQTYKMQTLPNTIKNTANPLKIAGALLKILKGSA